MKISEIYLYRMALETLPDSQLKKQRNIQTKECDRLRSVIRHNQSLLALENRLLKHVEREQEKRKRARNHVSG